MSITLEQLIQWRREFHRFPEIGWSEFWTTSRIADYLEEMGFDILLGDKIINPEFVRGRQQAVVEAGLAKAIAYGAKAKWLDQMKGYTGCVAVLDTGKPGKTVALRFDIDCVNVSETTHPEHIPNQYGFASLNDGFMHACGHDAHITIGLGTAKWLAENKDKLRGKIKIVFQPAEEGVRGLPRLQRVASLMMRIISLAHILVSVRIRGQSSQILEISYRRLKLTFVIKVSRHMLALRHI